MSPRGIVLCLALAAAGCGDSTFGISHAEFVFLSEDVVDLVTIVFQAGENAFVGDPVEPEDVVDVAGPGNDFTVTYDLPLEQRVGLGFGSGRATLRVVEDGVPSADPLAFSFGTTAADQVLVEYDLRYDGETAGDRATDVDLRVELSAVRAAGGGFLVDYTVEGEVLLGSTYCEIFTTFRAPGRPRDGIEPGVGDGDGFIDDLDVRGVFDLDLDWRTGEFRAEGDVGCCAYYEEEFLYTEVL